MGPLEDGCALKLYRNYHRVETFPPRGKGAPEIQDVKQSHRSEKLGYRISKELLRDKSGQLSCPEKILGPVELSVSCAEISSIRHL